MPGLVEKTLALARAGRHLPDRVRNRANVLLDWRSAPTDIRHQGDSATQFFRGLGAEAQSLDREAAANLEQVLTERIRILKKTNAPFSSIHNGTLTLGRLCYAVCRATRPRAVIETGVAYGVTSAYILQALAENGEGKLYSIDLPPLGRNCEDFVGYLVPQELRGRWDLRIGPARKLLPIVLDELGQLDVFIHDSLHTYLHMKWEFELALRALRPGGVLIADDIEGNRAFKEAVGHPSVESWSAIEQQGKEAVCGAIRIRIG